MCMEDVRIGRAALFSETQVAIGVASGNVVAASPNCFALVFSPPAAGTVTLSTNTPVVAGAGFALNANGLPLMLNIKDHGAMVTKAWFGIGSGATTIQVGQAIMPLQ